MFNNFLYNKSIFYFFVVFILNGSFLNFDDSFFLLQFFTVFVLLLTLFIDERKNYCFYFTNYTFDKLNILFSLLIIFPILFYFVFNINQEHPFSGDYKLHVENSLNTNQFWLDSIFYNLNLKNLSSYSFIELLIIFFSSRIFLLFIIFLIYFILFYYKKNITYFFLIFSLIIWTYLDNYNLTYPSGLYFISLPFNYLVHVFTDLSLMEGLRICNFLSIFIWLFLLRPLVIGKNPDLNVFLFSAFLLWKLEIIYLFTSSYVEPFGLICLFIALELSLNSNKNNNFTTAFWLGLSTCFKGINIFLFPFFWLMEQPWKMNLKTFLRHTLYYILYGIPFLHFYYNTRIIGSINRTLSFDFNELVIKRIDELFFRVLNYYTIIEILIFIILIIIILYKFFLKKIFFKYIILVFAAFFIGALFYLDGFSWQWTGYPRFVIYTFILLCGLFFYNKIIFHNNLIKLFFVFSFITIFTINFYKIYIFTLSSDTEKSFIFHYQEPIYLPLKSLINKFEDKNIIIDKPILVGVPHTHVFPLQDTFINNNYNYIWEAPFKLNCTCKKKYIILNTFLPKVNLHKNYDRRKNNFFISHIQKGEDHISETERMFINETVKKKCIEEITYSCKNIEFEFSSQNKIIGVIAKK